MHKSTIALNWLVGDAASGEDAVIPNRPKAIEKLFRKLGRLGELRCCYEAGPCGYELRRQLEKRGVACEVIAPSRIARQPAERLKTDRLDARKLARQYRNGDLTVIRVPSESEEADRDLVRCREDVREDAQRHRHQLLKFLLRHGRVWREGSHWTVAHWAWLRQQAFEQASAQRTYNEYVERVRATNERLGALDKELQDLAQQERWKDQIGRLRCLPGIDTLSALMLLVEVMEFRRFKSPRELMSFVGLTPGVHQSGESRARRGSITKDGNGHIRRVVVEAAWAYRHSVVGAKAWQRRCKGQPAAVVAEAQKAYERLRYKYRRMVERHKPTPMAATAVARELLGFIWALSVKHGDTSTAPAPATKARMYRINRKVA